MKRPNIHITRRGIQALIAAGCAFLVLIVVAKCGKASVQVSTKGTVLLTPTQIKHIRDIGQWEFLTIEDEEMVDTTASGLLTNKELIRLYYGTLRIGIDLSEAQDGWIRTAGDTIFATLPPLRLLNDEFIDEARTRSFYEDGHWQPADYARLYGKARRIMLQRCLTEENYGQAEEAAREAFGQLFSNFGFRTVDISVQPRPKRTPSPWNRIARQVRQFPDSN